ncbi:MAG: hypothetical protein M3Q49_03345 [Actinomycetota bacterium]|nr:hypothetical protein [Actinomycetota bacterium]
MEANGGYGRGNDDIPAFGRAVPEGSAGTPLLVVFCSGVSGRDTGGRPAYGFVVACRSEPPGHSSKPLGTRRSARSGGDPCGPKKGFEGKIGHSQASLIGDGADGELPRGLGKEAILAVLEYRAVLAALAWLEARGRSCERILLFTGSRPLAKREEEPFGLWRATRRRTGEGTLVKEVLASLSRFGDLWVKWWRPSDPEGVGETGGLASRAAKEISARARVAVLEEGRRERARDVKLERVGRGVYRANERYLVDATFGLCGCRDFERHNGKKRRKKGEAGVPFVVVRCKHLIAAEEAEGRSDRREQDTAPSRSASTSPLIPGARSKARGGNAGGGHKP